VTAVVIFPTGLRVEWQGSGATVRTRTPILTWINPSNDVDQVVIKVRTDPDQSVCNPATSVLDFWYHTAETPPDGCPGSIKRRFTAGSPPTSLIVPPGLLNVSRRIYWSVWVRRGGLYYSSTGYMQGAGGSQTSRDFFDFVAPTFPQPHYKFGIGAYQYYSEKGSPTTDWRNHLDWAANLLGPGGYIKLMFPWVGDADAPLARYQTVLNEVYARRLNPIVRLEGAWATKGLTPPILAGQEFSGSWRRPPQDGEGAYIYSSGAGTYGTFAARLVSFVSALPTPPAGRPPLYLELWNEVNYNHIEWSDDNAIHLLEGEAENYARFYADVYRQLGALGRPIELMNGGLGRSGYRDFLLRIVDELHRLEAAGQLGPGGASALLRNFAVHIYPDPGQETRQISDGEDEFFRSPFNYKHQIDLLSRRGIDVSAIRVFVTEGGYIGQPSFDPTAQASLVLRLIDLWADDPRLEAITFFALDDYTDRTVFPYIPRPLDSVAWVRSGVGTSGGLPDTPRPVYPAARARFGALRPPG
jgi:hypothetical protein